MDFDKLIRDLVKSGADIEDLAEEFTKALNKAQAANKSKKMVDEYIRGYDVVYGVKVSREGDSFLKSFRQNLFEKRNHRHSLLGGCKFFVLLTIEI